MDKMILSVKNVTVKYRDFIALYNASFGLNRGELAIIIGPNGAGKTTLLKAILGLIPYKGKVEIFGKPVSKLSREEHMKIGYVPQHFSFSKKIPITVEEVMLLPMVKTTLSRQERIKRVDTFLKMGHMEHLKHIRIGELSGGQIQRVLMARALAFTPEIVFFDEPLAGIDIAGEKTFYEFIDAIHIDYKITIVLVSHDVTVVDKFADKVICVNKKIVCYGRPQEVFSEDKLSELYGHDVGAFHHKPCPEGGPCELFKKQEIGDK